MLALSFASSVPFGALQTDEPFGNSVGTSLTLGGPSLSPCQWPQLNLISCPNPAHPHHVKTKPVGSYRYSWSPFSATHWLCGLEQDLSLHSPFAHLKN